MAGKYTHGMDYLKHVITDIIIDKYVSRSKSERVMHNSAVCLTMALLVFFFPNVTIAVLLSGRRH